MPTIATPPHAGLFRPGHENRRSKTSPSPALRLRVWVRRFALTQRLSEGADPASSPDLELRARQLVGDRERATLARTLQRTLNEIRDPRMTLVGGTPLRRREVLVAEKPIRRMIERLRDGRPVAPEGMALIERIITDGEWSPLYNSTVPGALRRLTVLATAALDPEL
jgi:hypothetical protein